MQASETPASTAGTRRSVHLKLGESNEKKKKRKKKGAKKKCHYSHGGQKDGKLPRPRQFDFAPVGRWWRRRVRGEKRRKTSTQKEKEERRRTGDEENSRGDGAG